MREIYLPSWPFVSEPLAASRRAGYQAYEVFWGWRHRICLWFRKPAPGGWAVKRFLVAGHTRAGRVDPDTHTRLLQAPHVESFLQWHGDAEVSVTVHPAGGQSARRPIEALRAQRQSSALLGHSHARTSEYAGVTVALRAAQHAGGSPLGYYLTQPEGSEDNRGPGWASRPNPLLFSTIYLPTRRTKALSDVNISAKPGRPVPATLGGGGGGWGVGVGGGGVCGRGWGCVGVGCGGVCLGVVCAWL